MNSDELSDRLWQFAARVGKLVDAPPETRLGQRVAGQLVRCGTSAPPNDDERCAAESRADFAHKLSVALKQLKETRGWLRFIPMSNLLPEQRIAVLIDECQQLIKVVGKSVSTAKGKSRRPPPM